MRWKRALAISAAIVIPALAVAVLAHRARPRRSPPTRAFVPNVAADTQRSCDSGAPGAGDSCGPSRAASCCDGRAVPGGTFLRSYDGIECRDATNQATVSPFTLDVYEVSVGRFRAFTRAGKGTASDPPRPGSGAHPRISSSGWDNAWNASLAPDLASLSRGLACHQGFSNWTDADAGNEQLPINCITWFEAFAFCAWDGGRLPTDAERAFAASGGSEQRVFPWSEPPGATSIDASRAVYASERTLAVGSKPSGDGRWGHADLAGNVWEWTLDGSDSGVLLPSLGADRCGADGFVRPCVDCAELDIATTRVLRGGGFGMPAPGMIASVRRANPPGHRQSVFGVRCARDVGASSSAPVASGRASFCTPSCEGKSCGPDGCGGSCGSCLDGAACGGAARCVPYPRGPYDYAEGATLPSAVLTAVSLDRVTQLASTKPLSLVDLHDPSGATPSDAASILDGGTSAPRAMLLDLAAGWSAGSRDEAAALAALWPAYQRRGALFVLLYLDGERRDQAADVTGLAAWLAKHPTAYPAAIDPTLELTRLVRARPSKAVVDLRTMKIVAIASGPQAPGSALFRALDALLAR